MDGKIGVVVPCGTCRLCCRKNLIRLLPGDDPKRYLTMPHPIMTGALAIAQTPDGDCVYLSESDGCTIHDSKPTICRIMDCRILARIMSSNEARHLGPSRQKEYKRGLELLVEGDRHGG